MLALTSARALLDHGLTGIVLLDLPNAIEKAQTAIQALKSEFSSANIITKACDMTKEKGMIAATQFANSKLGEIYILCCFAGMVGCVPSEEKSVDHWQKIIDVNTTGCLIAARTIGRCVFGNVFCGVNKFSVFDMMTSKMIPQRNDLEQARW